MNQNRKKLMDKFIGNLSNAVIHEILDKAINDEEISKRYTKEMTTSLDRAIIYREKINPKNLPFTAKDTDYLKSKIYNKVKSELNKRILMGYKNINLELIELLIEKYLKKFKIV